ncbi:MAG: hypothetical protein AAGI34_12500 [Pseudomonadota bacterium]
MFIIVLRAVLVLVLLAAVYVGLAAFMRWQRQRTLEAEYAAGVEPALTREDYIAKGLAAYERSPERKALYAVFIVPLIVGAILGALSALT